MDRKLVLDRSQKVFLKDFSAIMGNIFYLNPNLHCILVKWHPSERFSGMAYSQGYATYYLVDKSGYELNEVLLSSNFLAYFRHGLYSPPNPAPFRGFFMTEKHVVSTEGNELRMWRDGSVEVSISTYHESYGTFDYTKAIYNKKAKSKKSCN